MKRKITLLLLATGSLFKMNSQVLINEGFTSPFNPTTAGWIVNNLSAPLGTTTWTQGTTNYAAYDGNTTDYYFANYNSAGATAPAGISNWFITPPVTIYNGAVIQFATKTIDQGTGQPNFSPDRLQLRMSQSGVATIPTGTNSVGTFTDLLLDINPLLNTSTVSAVNNGSVNGYPNAWTVYSVQITGVTGTMTAGRFAFRYFVDDAGNGGLNSNNIGLDAVKYTLPCGPTVQNYTTCAGASTTLQAMGLPATTYSWSTGATTSSVVVSPGTTTTYSLYPSANSLSCGNVVTAVVTVSSNLAVNVSASSTSVCVGETVTLTASGAASSYSWAVGTTPIGGGSVITVTPSANTTYSVAGFNGSCLGGSGISITTLANPNIAITSASTLLCVSGASVPVTFSASGGVNYLWVLGSSSTTGSVVNVNIAAQNATTSPAYQVTLGLLGDGTNGCVSSTVYTLTINRTPTVSVASSTVKACTNSTVTITATPTSSNSVVSSYSWTSGAVTGTGTTLSLPTGSVAGTKTISVIVKSAAGCTNTATYSQSVAVCSTTTNTTSTVGIPSYNGSEEMSIYPNPFTTELSVNVLDGTVLVYNAIGQVVIRTAVHSSEIINTTDLPKGVYFVKAYNENGEMVKTVKLIKN